MARGERHGFAKLTAQDVRHIRTSYARGDISQSELASQYNVTRVAVSQVILRKTWSHVE